MYDEITFKFKEILNRIILCINNYIDKNLKNPNLVESKLLSINNYIIDILHKDTTHNSCFFNSRSDSQSDSFSEKMVNQKNNSREYDKKDMTLGRLKNKYFTNIKDQMEPKILGYMDNNHNIKENQLVLSNKYKIVNLKRNLQNNKEQKVVKEFSLLKRLSDLQKKLIIHEFKNKNKIRDRNHNGLNNFPLNNKSYNKSKNNYIINLYPNNCKVIKQSLSQCKLKSNKNKINNDVNEIEDINKKYDFLKKKKILEINNAFKYDLGEIKKTLDRKMDKIKIQSFHTPCKSNRVNKKNN